MENKIDKVAELLGLELEEEFKIKNFEDHGRKYKITKAGILYWTDDNRFWFSSSKLENLILGYYNIIRVPRPVLDEPEKRYLTNIIKPFKDQVIAIAKRSANYGEFIDIMIDEGDIGDCGNIYLPYFKPNSMYKGMKVNREYTLDQLEL